MDKTIRRNTESIERKNPLRARYLNLSPTSRRKLKLAFIRHFEIKERPFYHRLSGRDELSKEEVKFVNSWKLK
jgi:hypothetical protein